MTPEEQQYEELRAQQTAAGLREDQQEEDHYWKER